VHYGRVVDGDRTVDDVLATLFRAPHSYTGEDSVELSCHGSPYIVSEVLRLLRAAGARMAEPGEFTIRAYLAGKLDLAQAEAVADLIASSSRAAHALASAQLRGGYSAALDGLRDRLLELVALLELELDFSEEDVEFADRGQLRETMERIRAEIDRLHDSFRLGNAIKEGVAVALVGAPNVGKSTLLNRLLGEERAMVIERTLAGIERARIVVRLVDAANAPIPPIEFALRADQTLLTVVNKTDIAAPACALPDGAIGISARRGDGIDRLRSALRAAVDTESLYHGDPIVSNSRHCAALDDARRALDGALAALRDELPADLLSEELRHTVRSLGAITARGAIAPDEVLQHIFSKFCIGK